jgi:hypothetical protein
MACVCEFHVKYISHCAKKRTEYCKYMDYQGKRSESKPLKSNPIRKYKDLFFW